MKWSIVWDGVKQDSITTTISEILVRVVQMCAKKFKKIEKIRKINKASQSSLFTMVYHKISADMKQQALELLEEGWEIRTKSLRH